METADGYYGKKTLPGHMTNKSHGHINNSQTCTSIAKIHTVVSRGSTGVPMSSLTGLSRFIAGLSGFTGAS